MLSSVVVIQGFLASPSSKRVPDWKPKTFQARAREWASLRLPARVRG